MKQLKDQKWHAVNWSGSVQIRDEDGTEIAIVKREDWDALVIPSQDTRNKAILIAAAPELLEIALRIYKDENANQALKDTDLRDLEEIIKKATL